MNVFVHSIRVRRCGIGDIERPVGDYYISVVVGDCGRAVANGRRCSKVNCQSVPHHDYTLESRTSPWKTLSVHPSRGEM